MLTKRVVHTSKPFAGHSLVLGGFDSYTLPPGEIKASRSLSLRSLLFVQKHKRGIYVEFGAAVLWVCSEWAVTWWKYEVMTISDG